MTTAVCGRNSTLAWRHPWTPAPRNKVPNNNTSNHASVAPVAEFRIAAGATQRLLLDSGGSGRLLLGATCSMALRELPHNSNGQLDLGADPGANLPVGSGDPAHYPLTAPLTSFGVAPGEDCGEQTHTLLVAWSPAPPRLTATHDGKLLVRQPGRYQVDLVDGAAPKGFPLPKGAGASLDYGLKGAIVNGAAELPGYGGLVIAENA